MPRRLEGDFDYIVVGAGTAGCIVANRLSADPNNRVLILEAGGNDNWIWFHIPVGYLFAIGNPRSDWMFRTEPEAGLNGRSLAYPRGKVIGGSSAINAMISMRGQAADYDHWRQLGLTGWGYDDVLPAFRRLEDHFLGDSEHHGTGGGWRIEAPRLSWAILDAVGDAAAEMGIRKIPDFNTGDNEGVGYFHVNQKRGRRWSSARGFLKPALTRPNLRLEKNVLVDRLIVEQGRAVGVRFMQGGEVIEARAKGEVILCAGSIGSTQVLHRSGIGPSDWLAPLGIEMALDRQGVGRNLQDHLQQRAIYQVEGVRTLNETYYSLLRRGLMGLDYAFRRRGPLTMAPSQLGIFTRSDPHRERANIQFHVQPLSLDKFGDPLHRFPAITVSACNLQPTSRGTVRIRSAKADEAPAIAPNYLSTGDDRQVAADAIRATRRLMKQPALAPYRPQEYLPGPSVGDDDASLAKAAGDIGTTIFHPVGTAKMGTASDPLAVVDERLRFYGLAGLRVVDASVMPTITSGNTNTPTAMIAEKGASMILEDSRATLDDEPASPMGRPCRRAHCAGAMGRGRQQAARAAGARHRLRRRGLGRGRARADVDDTPSTASTAAATAPATSRQPSAITSWISHPISAPWSRRSTSPTSSASGTAPAPPIFCSPPNCCPGGSRGLFVMEPTIMDPRARKADGAALSDNGKAYAQGVLRRQREFDSAAAAFQRFRAASAFAELVRGRIVGLCAARFRNPAGRPGAAAVQAGDRSRDAGADLRSDGTGLRRR